MKNADHGLIFHGCWGVWELQPSGWSGAFLPLREKWLCVVEGNKDMEWGVSWLRAKCHTRHTYVWIFHVQPQSEQQKTLMFVYASVLLSCIQVSLIMTYCSNTKTKHKGFTLAYKSYFEQQNFYPFLLWWMQPFQNIYEIPANTQHFFMFTQNPCSKIMYFLHLN